MSKPDNFKNFPLRNFEDFQKLLKLACWISLKIYHFKSLNQRSTRNEARLLRIRCIKHKFSNFSLNFSQTFPFFSPKSDLLKHALGAEFVQGEISSTQTQKRLCSTRPETSNYGKSGKYKFNLYFSPIVCGKYLCQFLETL